MLSILTDAFQRDNKIYTIKYVCLLFLFLMRTNRSVDLWTERVYFPGGGNGNPLQYSCLEIPMDRVAWRAMVLRVAEPDTTEPTEQSIFRQCITYMHITVSAL